MAQRGFPVPKAQREYREPSPAFALDLLQRNGLTPRRSTFAEPLYGVLPGDIILTEHRDPLPDELVLASNHMGDSIRRCRFARGMDFHGIVVGIVRIFPA